jgi:hypothetical protein
MQPFSPCAGGLSRSPAAARLGPSSTAAGDRPSFCADGRAPAGLPCRPGADYPAAGCAPGARAASLWSVDTSARERSQPLRTCGCLRYRACAGAVAAGPHLLRSPGRGGGSGLLDELLRRKWVEPSEGGRTRTEYRLTATGETALRERGVDIAGAARSRRLFAFGCPDWTEQRPHLGGALGAALLDALVAAGVAQRGIGRTITLWQSLEVWLAGQSLQAADSPSDSRLHALLAEGQQHNR